eukprot:13197-Prymnesium_polylepis.1
MMRARRFSGWFVESSSRSTGGSREDTKTMGAAMLRLTEADARARAQMRRRRPRRRVSRLPRMRRRIVCLVTMPASHAVRRSAACLMAGENQLSRIGTSHLSGERTRSCRASRRLRPARPARRRRSAAKCRGAPAAA